MDVTQLALTWLGDQKVKNLRQLGCKFDLDQSEHKSLQVNASARPGQMESQVDQSFQLTSTCNSVWPGLNTWSALYLF